VVTGVSEEPEESHAVIPSIEVPLTGVPLLQQRLHYVQDPENELMLLAEHTGRRARLRHRSS
jgi:hypothetical protein